MIINVTFFCSVLGKCAICCNDITYSWLWNFWWIRWWVKFLHMARRRGKVQNLHRANKRLVWAANSRAAVINFICMFSAENESACIAAWDAVIAKCNFLRANKVAITSFSHSSIPEVAEQPRFIFFSMTRRVAQRRLLSSARSPNSHGGFNFFIFWSWKVVVCWEKWSNAEMDISHLSLCLSQSASAITFIVSRLPIGFQFVAGAHAVASQVWTSLRISLGQLGGRKFMNSFTLRATQRRESLLMEAATPTLRNVTSCCERKKWEEFGRK